MMGHRLAVPPRSVIGSLSQVKIGSMESMLPCRANTKPRTRQHGYIQASLGQHIEKNHNDMCFSCHLF